ncbi:unnamed protein product [Heterobilharzia americana]|nr:unnamed protein product [Heterobilharzia americana]
MVAPPGFMWLTGYLTALQSIIFLTTSLTFLTACLLFVFIIYQFNLMLSNQTMFERAFKSFSRQYQYTNSSGVCNKTMRTCLQTKGDTDIKTTTAATVYQQHQPVNNDSSACIYNVGYMNNIKQYLGERWILALLCPLINSPLTTDGLNFPISDGVKFK